MADAKTHIRATAAKVGNGAHVIVPKDWLGLEVVCVPAGRLVALAENLHGRGDHPPPARLLGEGSMALTRTASGWQVLATASREARTVQVWLAEHGWRAYALRRLDKHLVLEADGEPLALPPGLEPWIHAVMAGEGLAAKDLPGLDSDAALQRIRRRLLSEKDPARLRALARELSRLLGD